MNMYSRATYAVMRPTSTRILPSHKIIQISARHFSTESIVKFPVLEFKQSISVRVMTKQDLQMVMGWAAREGWNPGKYEVEPLYAVDPRGYKVLEVDGEPIASLASVQHSQDFAFLGLYIVKPEFRGKGYGKLLWDISMGTLVDCKTIGLNGVLSQIDNYRKSGFYPSHLNTRWQGTSFYPFNKTDPAKDVILKRRDDFSFSRLIDYDAKIFTTPRSAFLNKWLAMPESHVLAAVDGDILRGYGVISAAEQGYKVAPLFADNIAIAEKLYGALCQCIGDKKSIYLDTAETNPHVSILAKRFGLEKTFDTLRMYRGQAPQIQDSKIFGLTTLEIG